MHQWPCSPCAVYLTLPWHHVSSPSIWELSLWLSTSGMLTRNCRWSRRMSRVRIPSVCSMSCWVSAKDMSWLATPLIWRGRVGGLRESRPQEHCTRMGCSDCHLPGHFPFPPALPSSCSFTYSVCCSWLLPSVTSFCTEETLAWFNTHFQTCLGLCPKARLY